MALPVSMFVAVLAIASSATAKPLLSQQAERLVALRGGPYPHARPQALAARLEAALPYEGAMLVAPGAGGQGPYGRGPGAMMGPPGAAGGRPRLAEAAGSQQQQQPLRGAGLADLSGPQLARLRQLAAEYAAEGQLRAALGYGPGYPGAGPRAQQLQQQQLQQLLLLQLQQQQQPELEDNLVEEEVEDDDDDENDDVEEEEEEEEDEVEPDATEGDLGYAELAEALVRALAAELGEEAAAERAGGAAGGWRAPAVRSGWGQQLSSSSQQQLPNTIAGEGIGQQQQRLDEEALGRIVGYLFGSAADGYVGNDVRPRYRRDAQLQQQQQQQAGYGDGGDGVAADRRLKGAASAAAAAAAAPQQQRARVKRVRRDAPPAEPLIRVKRIDPSESDERSASSANSAMSGTTTTTSGGGGARVTRRERRSVAPQAEEALELRGLVGLARASGTRLRRLRRAVRAVMK